MPNASSSFFSLPFVPLHLEWYIFYYEPHPCWILLSKELPFPRIGANKLSIHELHMAGEYFFLGIFGVSKEWE
jgi:hypothetical protein